MPSPTLAFHLQPDTSSSASKGPSPEELKEYGVTPGLIETVAAMTYSTFSDYPMDALPTTNPLGLSAPIPPPSFRLTPWQVRRRTRLLRDRLAHNHLLLLHPHASTLLPTVLGVMGRGTECVYVMGAVCFAVGIIPNSILYAKATLIQAHPTMQERHGLLVIQSVENLNGLRFALCPK